MPSFFEMNKAIKDVWGGFLPEEICRFACINSSLVQSTAVRFMETNTGDCDCEKEERGTSEITLCSHLPCVSVSSTDRFCWEGPQSIWSVVSFLESYFDFFFSGETANSVQFAIKTPKLKRKNKKKVFKPLLGRWTFNEVLGKKAAQRQNVISMEHGPLKSTGMKLIPNVKSVIWM